MNSGQTIEFTLVDAATTRPVDFPVREVVLAGYSGRNQADVESHFEELKELGLPAPDEAPIFFRVSTNLVTTGDRIEVQDGSTSGEVEFVLLFDQGATFVTVGSDHTSRGFEKHSIPASKQMYPKVLGKQLWNFAEITDHWDQLVLRSWSFRDGRRNLYQESALVTMMEPDRLVERARDRVGMGDSGCIFMSGTIPTVAGGMVYADRLEYELEDPVIGRKIRHGYDIERL
jgi:hypothetical protein